MEATPGHLTGILNDLLFFWQTITMYTPAHRNKWWCMACEFAVTIHGPLIAIGRGGGAGMFGFGFTIVFLCTGMWGLPIGWATRVCFFIIFLTTCLMNYGLGWSKTWSKAADGTKLVIPVQWKHIHEITRIPMMYYMIMSLYFLVYLCFRWIQFIEHKKCKTALAIMASLVGASIGFFPFMAIVGFN